MKLDERFSLKGDAYEWKLTYREETDEINPKTGKNKVKTNYWHYPTIKLALKRYLDECLKDCESTQQVLVRIDEVEDVILKLNVKQ